MVSEINWPEITRWLKWRYPKLKDIANGYFYRRTMIDPGTFSMREAAVNILPRLHSQASILDVGTGVGTWLLYLHHNGFSCARGIDIDRYSTVAIAKGLLSEFGGLPEMVSQGNLWEIGGVFNLITIFDCLYDLSPKQKPIAEVMQHLRQHLRKGGFAAFDYYVSEDNPKSGRGYQHVEEIIAQAKAAQLVPTELFIRIMGGREIAFYVLRAE